MSHNTEANNRARVESNRAYAEMLSLNARIGRLRDAVAEGRATPEHVEIARGIADGLSKLNEQFGRYAVTI